MIWVSLPTSLNSLRSWAPPGDLEGTQTAGADLARGSAWALGHGDRISPGSWAGRHAGNTGVETWHRQEEARESAGEGTSGQLGPERVESRPG